MKQLLRLKHWQLFFLILIPIMLAIFIHMYRVFSLISEVHYNTPTNPEMVMTKMFAHMPYVMVLTFLSVFLILFWQWSVATLLHDKLPPDSNLKLGFFKVAIIVLALSYLAIVGIMINFMSSMDEFMLTAQQNGQPPMGMFAGMFMMFPLQILAMISAFYGYYFCARTIKTVEEQRDLSFSDYIGEFFLMWFSFIGVWILQPRLNKLVDKSKEELQGDAAVTFDSFIDDPR